VGILFDMLGIASTAANEAPFHAMASEKVKGAKESVIIIRNADKFASFSNDVIGDISGIVSGTASAIVVLQIAKLMGHGEGSAFQIILSVLLTSLVAALTVGGKAMGKYFAINKSTNIIIVVGKIISFIENNLKIKVLPKSNEQRILNMSKQRLDLLLVERNLMETREKAKRNIMAGLVFS